MKAAQQLIQSLKFKVKVSRLLCFALLIAIFYFALCTLNLSEARAQNVGRSFSISPPTVQFELKPGAKSEKTIKITNNSRETAEFVVNVQDFIVSDKSGSPELLPEGIEPDNKYAASTWATVLPDRFTVLPEQTTTVTLYLQSPETARPGGKYVAVAFKPITGSGPDNTGASINTVIGSLVYLTVEGEIEENANVVQFKIPGFSEYGPISFNTEIKNLGDIHINPKASVEVKDIFGRKVYSFALDSLNIFPGTSRIYKNSWEQKWLFGRFTASLSGYYGTTSPQNLAAITSFWVIPYKLIVIILLALAIGVTTFFYVRRKNEPQEILDNQ